MSVLAIDLGTTTGWAWAPTRDALLSGTMTFKNGRYEGGGMRYLRFRQWLDTLHDHKLSAIYFEEVRRHLGTDAAHVYGGLLATLTTWCEEHSIPYAGVPVGTIKKFWTGKGNATKDEMIAEAVARGHEVVDDNEADAIALLKLKTESDVNSLL